MSAEAEVVAQLQAALAKLDAPKDAPVDANPPTPDEIDTFHELSLDPVRAKAELMEFFDIKSWMRMSPDMTTKITAVLDWATEEAGYLTEAPSLADILKAVNDRMRIMGIVNHEDKLNRLWRFTKIQQAHRLLIEKERALNG